MKQTPTPTATFQHRIPVRWRDLDTFNHVNNANYLSYLEEARLQWLRGFATDWDKVTAAPVMASVQLNYRTPINWPGEVLVTQSIERLGNTSLTLANRIESIDGSTLYCDGQVVLVWIDRASGKPVPLPHALRAVIGSDGSA